MCVFSAPKPPPPVAVPTAPTAVAQESDPQVQQAQTTARQRRLRAADGNSTLVTGGTGLTTQAQTGLKQAFGQ